jgi:hypothetical protein
MKQITFVIILNFLAMQSINAQETPKIKITVGATSFVVTTYDNATARGFLALLPMTVTMNDVNRNEKFRPLQSNLPTSPEIPPKINAGDLMLWGTDGLVLFYETFTTSYSYSKIGYMKDASGLKTALGPDNPTVTFELIGNSTGIGSIEQNKAGFKISSDGLLQYTGNAKRITLIDMNGKILTSSTSKVFNVTSFPKGIYILKAEEQNQTKTIKINI